MYGQNLERQDEPDADYTTVCIVPTFGRLNSPTHLATGSSSRFAFH